MSRAAAARWPRPCFLFIMKCKAKIVLAAVLLLLVAGSAWWGSRPWLYAQGETEMIAAVPAQPEEPLEISFIHSVQKTPVEEFLTVSQDQQEIILNSTRYHSFGVGLPFMESDGHFYQDGNDFVMDDMNRHFAFLSLRTGLGTKLTLTLGQEKYPVYEKFDPGYRVDIFIAPRAYILKYYGAQFSKKF